MSTLLKGNKICLRAMEPEDVDVMYLWENDPDVWHLSSTFAPYSRHILSQLAISDNDIYTNKQLRLIICCEDERPVGAIDLFDFSPHHKRAGVGILIADKNDRRKGYGSEALDLVIEYAFDTLQLHQLYCHILSDNHDSKQLFEKKGFTVNGTRRQWVNLRSEWKDEHFLQLIATEKTSG